MEGVELSAGQQEALEGVLAWYHGRQYRSDVREPERSVHRLFGYAGTGKTTLARIIVDSLGLDPGKVRYATYTGKAAHVLRSKGAEDASTIHSLIYMPREQAKSRLAELRDELREAEAYVAQLQIISRGVDPDDLAEQQSKVNLIRFKIRMEEKRLESPEFLLREPAESLLTGSDLLVLDEVSMVGDPIARDLLGFGVPILALGDPAQLPPVDGGGYFINRPADALLTEIHRSALDSPVTRIATQVRMANGDARYGVTGMWGNSAIGGSGRLRDLPPEYLTDFDQVLVGTNAVRWQAIRTLRRLEGLPDQAAPVVGDKIIILANNGEAEVLNGQIYTVRQAQHGRVHDLEVYGEDGAYRELAVHPHGFRGPDGERTARLMGTRGAVAAATFAQAITVHKAQGSQWGRVLVVDESHVFQRMHRGPRSDQYRAGQRWLYTGVTRASDQVVITSAGSIRE